MNFISEKELDKQRNENPDDAGSSEPADNRPLYERLKEVRDKKQLEWEEEHALKNQFAVTRGIDDGDADFLIQVDRIKDEQETSKRNEEQELFRLAKEQSVIRAPDPAQDRLDRPQRKGALTLTKATTSKQANLVSSLVRKRPYSSTNTQSDADAKPAPVAHSDSLPDNVEDVNLEQTVENNDNEKCEETTRTHCKLIGILPGMIDYEDSSDESNSSASETLDSELPTVAVYAGKGPKKAAAGETCGN